MAKNFKAGDTVTVDCVEGTYIEKFGRNTHVVEIGGVKYLYDEDRLITSKETNAERILNVTSEDELASILLRFFINAYDDGVETFDHSSALNWVKNWLNEESE